MQRLHYVKYIFSSIVDIEQPYVVSSGSVKSSTSAPSTHSVNSLMTSDAYMRQ